MLNITRLFHTALRNMRVSLVVILTPVSHRRHGFGSRSAQDGILRAFADYYAPPSHNKSRKDEPWKPATPPKSLSLCLRRV